MSRTYRWWHRKRNAFLFEKYLSDLTPVWKNINPFYFRHELKIIRVKLHRASRKNNKVLLQKGRDIEPEIKTNGWETH